VRFSHLLAVAGTCLVLKCVTAAGAQGRCLHWLLETCCSSNIQARLRCTCGSTSLASRCHPSRCLLHSRAWEPSTASYSPASPIRTCLCTRQVCVPVAVGPTVVVLPPRWLLRCVIGNGIARIVGPLFGGAAAVPGDAANPNPAMLGSAGVCAGGLLLVVLWYKLLSPAPPTSSAKAATVVSSSTTSDDDVLQPLVGGGLDSRHSSADRTISWMSVDHDVPTGFGAVAFRGAITPLGGFPRAMRDLSAPAEFSTSTLARRGYIDTDLANARSSSVEYRKL
jgi:hypothetical protein